MRLADAKAKLWGNPPFTWAGHAYMSGQFAVPPLVAARALGWLPAEIAHWAYVGICASWLAFYLAREASDEMHHRVRGDYDLPQAGQPSLTSRVDKIGDSLGPAVVGIAAVTTALFTLEGWWWPLAPWAASTLAIVRAGLRIIKRR